MGISGSGKSTLAKKLISENRDNRPSVACSADDYFINERGEYKFDPTLLDEAHGACMRKFIKAMLPMGKENSLVIVDNTNTTIGEIAPYIAVAKAYLEPNIDSLSVVYVSEDHATAAKRNTHGVPAHAVFKQHEQIKKTNKEWPRFWPEIKAV